MREQQVAWMKKRLQAAAASRGVHFFPDDFDDAARALLAEFNNAGVKIISSAPKTRWAESVKTAWRMVYHIAKLCPEED